MIVYGSDRRTSFLLMIAVGLAFTNAGCDSLGRSDGDMAKPSPEVEKKTEEMLRNMHKNMEEKHKAEKKKGGKAR